MKKSKVRKVLRIKMNEQESNLRGLGISPAAFLCGTFFLPIKRKYQNRVKGVERPLKLLHDPCKKRITKYAGTIPAKRCLHYATGGCNMRHRQKPLIVSRHSGKNLVEMKNILLFLNIHPYTFRRIDINNIIVPISEVNIEMSR